MPLQLLLQVAEGQVLDPQALAQGLVTCDPSAEVPALVVLGLLQVVTAPPHPQWDFQLQQFHLLVELLLAEVLEVGFLPPHLAHLQALGPRWL